MKASAYILIAVLVAGVVFLFPISRRRDLKLFWKVTKNQAPLVVTGNSAAVTASPCDSSARNIPDLLSDSIHRGNLDLAYPGQTLTESASLAALSMRTRAPKDVVALLSYFEFEEWDNLDLQQYLLTRLASPGLAAEPWLGRLLSGCAVSGEPHRRYQPFSYGGQDYPAYDRLAATTFEAERSAMPCPENDGSNRAFLEAHYYQQYVHFPPNPRNVELLGSLQRIASKAGKRLWIVLMPIDYEQLGRMQPDVTGLVRQRADEVIAALRGQGLAVIDLSGLVENSDFADRWCACGHLQLAGRKTVAAALGDRLLGAPSQSQAR